MRRAGFLRWSLAIAGSLVVVLLGAAVALTLWLRPQPISQGALAYGDATLEPDGPATLPERERWAVEMAAAAGSGLPPLHALVERPCRKAKGPAPALLLLGGQRAGAGALDRVAFPGALVMAALDYPYDKPEWKAASVLGRAKIGAGMIPAATEQAAALLAWLARQPEVDPSRVVFVGVSLGAVTGPAVLARAQAAGTPVAAGVLAFGAADLPLLLDQLLAKWLPWEAPRRLLAHWAAWIFDGYAPERHLPGLRTPLLLIEAEDDDLLPAAGLAALRDAAPKGTRVMGLRGGHIEGGKEALVQETAVLVRDWLLERGLLRPDEIGGGAPCPGG